MSNSILFESLIHLLSITESRIAHGQNAILLLTLLGNNYDFYMPIRGAHCVTDFDG